MDNDLKIKTGFKHPLVNDDIEYLSTYEIITSYGFIKMMTIIWIPFFFYILLLIIFNKIFKK